MDWGDHGPDSAEGDGPEPRGHLGGWEVMGTGVPGQEQLQGSATHGSAP